MTLIDSGGLSISQVRGIIKWPSDRLDTHERVRQAQSSMNYFSSLYRCFPEGIDIYFDNVGGRMLEAAVANMNPHGRVAACGVISEYTNATERAAPNMIDVIYKRIKIQGFLSSDFMNVHADFHSRTLEYLKAGKIKVLEDISHGVENIPSAFIGLFRGDNIGKKMVQIADE